MRTKPTRLLLMTVLALPWAAPQAAVLPEDRADVLYHRYEGGGVTIDGPSLLVRKKIAEKYSVSANYYVDLVSSASVDVVTTASPYREERQQASLGFDLLQGKTQYSLSITGSDENDYTAKTASFDVSQDFFGDLTSVSFGYSQGWDEVRRRGDNEFAEDVDRRSWRIGLSQVLTPKLLFGLSWELVSDEGFLNNPYRSVRYIDPESASGYAYQPEVYPHTRTSNAAAMRARYFLPWRAAAHGEVRLFTDTWGIDATTVEAGYTHPWGERWIFEFGYRWYDQSAADFYSDLFPYADAQNFLARDKELSTFSSHMLSLGATWQLPAWSFLQRSTLNLYVDYVMYGYEDFRDVRGGGAPGAEPLYDFDANVIRLFFSGWF
jgi:hypothetical protein